MYQGCRGCPAGAAVVPGRALMDTLPFVRQVVVVPEVWQFGSALATGADIAVVPNVAILDDGVAAVLRW